MQNTNNLVNLLNPGNVNPNANAKAGARVNAPPLPEISFNQVLSREIAQPSKAAINAAPAPTPNKNTSNSANSTHSANSSTSPNSSTQNTNANGSTQASNNANSSNNVNQSAESSNTSAEKSTSTGKTDEGSGKEAGTSTDTANNSAQNEQQAASQIDPTSALLALVASVGNHPGTSKAGSSTAAVAGIANGETANTEQADSLATAQLIQAGAPGSLTPGASTESSADMPGSLSPVLDKGTAIEADKGKGNPADPKLAKIQAEPTDSGSKATNSAAPTESFAAVHAATTTRRASAGDTLSIGKEGPATPIASAKSVSSVETAPALAKLQQAIGPRVGNPGWDQALGQRVVYMAGSGQQTASLSLNPPELGPLQVQLTISNDQTSASFTSALPEVRQALEAALPKLREMMNEAGIQLGSATVGTSLPNQQQSTPGEQSRSNQQSGQFDAPTPDNSLKPVKTTVIREALGVVDTFV